MSLRMSSPQPSVLPIQRGSQFRSRSTSLDRTLRQLLRSVTAGDRRSLDDLYDLTVTQVFGMVTAILDDDDRATELTEQIYVEIWRSAATFNPGQLTAACWILRVAHRLAIDLPSLGAADRSLEAEHPCSRKSDADLELVLRTRDRRQLRIELSALPVDQREALTVVYSDRLALSSASHLLGISVTTLRGLLRAGLNSLRSR